MYVVLGMDQSGCQENRGKAGIEAERGARAGKGGPRVLVLVPVLVLILVPVPVPVPVPVLVLVLILVPVLVLILVPVLVLILVPVLVLVTSHTFQHLMPSLCSQRSCIILPFEP
jgi:hypothetical protein